MKTQHYLSLGILILMSSILITGCSKQIEYKMMVTSEQDCGVMIAYPDDYWGELESLSIEHKENNGTSVSFHPQTITINGDMQKCIELNVPRPNQNELEWSEDKLSAMGHSTLLFKSDKQNITLRFEFSLHFSENKEIYGGSSMRVSAVICNGKKINRDEQHVYNNDYCFEIEELMK